MSHEETPLSPDASAEELYALAQEHPEMWGQLLAHPAMYPDLATWIQGQMTADLPPVPAPPDTETTKPVEPNPSRPSLPLVIGAAVILALVIGGGIFWFIRDRGPEPAGEALDHVPTKAHVVTVDGFDQNVTILPVDGELYRVDGDMRLVEVGDGTRTEVIEVEVGPVKNGQDEAAPTRMSHSTLEGDTWTLPGPSNTQVTCDGAEITALQGGEVLWSEDLTETDQVINGFTSRQPTWARAGDVLLYAVQGNLIAKEISTGKTLWKMDVPLTSYEVARDMILISMGDALALVPLDATAPDPGKAPTISAEAPSTEEVEEPDQVGIDPEALLNGTIEVSAVCAGRVTGDETAQSFTFSNGSVAGVGPAGSSIDIPEVVVVENGGEEYALAWLICTPPARSPSMEVAVYDADLSLIQSLYTYTGVNATIGNNTEITGFDAGNDRLSVDAGPWMGFGDTFCMSCDGSYFTTADYSWSGGQYELDQVMYDTPAGKVAAPSVDVLNQIYSSIAGGSDSGVSNYFTGEAAETLRTMDSMGIGEEEIRWYWRDIYFAPGGKVEGCALVPTEGSSPHIKASDTTLENFYFSSSIQPGDFVCTIDNNHELLQNSPNAHVWWLIRPGSTPDNFQIYEIGRDFA